MILSSSEPTFLSAILKERTSGADGSANETIPYEMSGVNASRISSSENLAGVAGCE
jgi:hypothetical protein